MKRSVLSGSCWRPAPRRWRRRRPPPPQGHRHREAQGQPLRPHQLDAGQRRDLQRRQRRRVHHRRRRDARRHEARRLGPGRPRQDEERHRQAGDDDHQHAHARRSHGNDDFFGATVEIVAQENTKANMEKMDAFKGDNAKFLPKKTYKDKMTLGSGKDRIDLYYFGAGHTNGDTFVVFPALRVLHTGDMFAVEGRARSAIATTAAAASSFPRTLQKVDRRHQERRHGHPRPQPDADAEGSAGCINGSPRICWRTPRRDEGRQERRRRGRRPSRSTSIPGYKNERVKALDPGGLRRAEEVN